MGRRSDDIILKIDEVSIAQLLQATTTVLDVGTHMICHQNYKGA